MFFNIPLAKVTFFVLFDDSLLLDCFFEDIDDVTLDTEVLSLVVESCLQLRHKFLSVCGDLAVLSIKRARIA